MFRKSRPSLSKHRTKTIGSTENKAAASNCSKEKEKKVRSAKRSARKSGRPHKQKKATPVRVTTSGGDSAGVDDAELGVSVADEVAPITAVPAVTLSAQPHRRSTVEGTSDDDSDRTRSTKSKLIEHEKLKSQVSIMKNASPTSPVKKTGKKKDESLYVNAACTYIEKRGWAGIEEDFERRHRPNCKEMNRDTRVILSTNVPPDSDYYDANFIEIPGADLKYIATSLPNHGDTNAVANFWRMVFDSGAANIVFMEGYNEDTLIYPTAAKETIDYGKMQVMYKKSTRSDKDVQSILEILPEGCSNSIVVRVIHVVWYPSSGDGRRRRMGLHPIRLLKDEKGIIMVACATGMMRCGTFIALHSAIESCQSKKPFNVPETIERMRMGRWGIVSTMESYLLIYVLLLEFFAVKRKNKQEVVARFRAILDGYAKHREVMKARKR